MKLDAATWIITGGRKAYTGSSPHRRVTQRKQNCKKETKTGFQVITITTEMLRKGAQPVFRDSDKVFINQPSMEVGRFHHGCVSIDGTAIVMGGYDGFLTFVN